MTHTYETTPTPLARPGAGASARDSETACHVTVLANWTLYPGGPLL